MSIKRSCIQHDTEKDQKPLSDHQPQPKTLAFVIMADKSRSNTVNPLHIEGDTSGAGAGSGARGRRAMSASAAKPAAAVPRRRAPTVTFKGSLVRYAPETRAAPSELQEGPPPSKFSILCGVGETKGPSLYRACISYVVRERQQHLVLAACLSLYTCRCMLLTQTCHHPHCPNSRVCCNHVVHVCPHCHRARCGGHRAQRCWCDGARV